MTRPHRAADVQPMDDDFWRRAETKAETGLDPTRLRRRPGRPPLAGEAAELTAVRLPPEVRHALAARADRDHTTASEVIRRALENYLAS